MSDRGGESPERDQEPKHAKAIADLIRSRIFVTVLSWTGILTLVGLLSDTAAIFSVIDGQPQAILTIVLLALLIVSVPVFLFKIAKTRMNTAIFVVLLVGLLVSTVASWPKSRKLSEWASDVNGTCVEEFRRCSRPRVGSTTNMAARCGR